MKNSLTKNSFIQRCSQYFFIGYVFLLLGCSSNEKKVATATPSSKVTALDSIGTWLSNENNYFEKNYHQVFFQHYTAQLKQQNIDSASYLLDIGLHNAVSNVTYDSILVKEALSFTTQYENKIEANRLLDIYNSIGLNYANNEAYSNGLIYFHKVLAKAVDPERNKAVGYAYRCIASAYAATDQLDSANQYALRTLKISENIADTNGISRSYDVLGNIYFNMDNIDEAMKYLQKYIDINKMRRDSYEIFTGYYNKLSILSELNSPKLVGEIDTLLNFYNQWQPQNIIYKTGTQIWTIEKLLRQNKLDAAKLLLDSLAPFIDDRSVIASQDNYYSALANYEKQKGQGTAHKALFDQKMKEKIKEKVWHIAFIYCEILRDDAELRKDYKDAFNYQKTYNDIHDSLTNKELKTTIIDLDKKYQTEKKELIIKQQEADAFKKNIFIAFLLVGFAALFYFYYTVRKKNTIISQQNELNEHTIAILSHDIKEPLLGVKLMLKRLNKDDPFVAQASQSLEGQINAVNGILTNLLKMKKLALTKKDKNVQADVNMVVKNVLQELNVAIQTKALTIENELTEGVVLPIAPEKLQIIAHNLLSNAVKYSFPNQKIRIFREGKGFCIQDFGVGLSPEQRSKLMREVTASQRGTSQERGNGLGLFLVGTMLQGEAIKVVFDSPEIGGTIAKVLVS